MRIYGLSYGYIGERGDNLDLKEIIKELEQLPRETLVFKNIKGKKQPYLQWSENGKTKSRYVKKDEREDLLKLFEKKNELKKLYNETVDKMLDDYADKDRWNRMMLVNIAKAGFFSSDRTIKQYNDDIWHLTSTE